MVRFGRRCTPLHRPATDSPMSRSDSGTERLRSSPSHVTLSIAQTAGSVWAVLMMSTSAEMPVSSDVSAPAEVLVPRDYTIHGTS